MTEEKYIHCDYLEEFIRVPKLKKRIKLAKAALKNYEFDAIAYSGHSGALIAIPCALSMNKPLILVRKNGEQTHSCYSVEGFASAKKYVILDDFVSCGDTYHHIVDEIKKFSPAAECIGLLQVRRLPLKSELWRKDE